MQTLTSALLACGARIDEINTLRRHLDRVKGGGIAKATKARVLSLILSDVVGSPLEAIASGPTAPDPTTKDDALAVLDKYFSVSLPRQSTVGLRGAGERRRGNLLAEGSSRLLRSARNDIKIPASILNSLSANPETPKPDDPIFSRVGNVIVGDNALAVQAALKQAEQEGFQAESLGSDWQGEARKVGLDLAQKLRVNIKSKELPFCLIAGGETTVTISGDGKGGRNQELALAAVASIGWIRKRPAHQPGQRWRRRSHRCSRRGGKRRNAPAGKRAEFGGGRLFVQERCVFLFRAVGGFAQDRTNGDECQRSGVFAVIPKNMTFIPTNMG